MASQQPPPPAARPWFRLAATPRPPGPAPAPAPAPQPQPPPPQPRPPSIRPTFTQTLATPPPPQTTQPPPTAATSSSVPTSPTLKAPAASLEESSSALQMPTVLPSLPTPAPPPQPPPSPLTLPLQAAQKKSDDAQHHPNVPPEDEQKTTLIQETIEKLNKMMPSASNGHLQRRKHKKLPESYDDDDVSEEFGFGTVVITITGENKGAIMEVSLTPSSSHMKGNDQASSEGEKWGIESSSDDEDVKKKKKDKNQKGMYSMSLNTFMNSNVQGVNSSIVCNCSCTHHDPGIHLYLSRNTNDSVKDCVNEHKH